MIKRVFWALFGTGLLLIISVRSYSVDLPSPLFPVENVILKRFVVEHIYPYTTMYYKQPLKLDVISKDMYKYDTPENALIAIISSMKNLDVEDTSAWDTESKIEEQEELKNEEYKQRIKAAWEENFKNAEFYLLRRVDRNNFVILDYSAKKVDGTEYKSTLNFRLENGLWKATNLFSDDYVSNYLNVGSTRIIGNTD